MRNPHVNRAGDSVNDILTQMSRLYKLIELLKSRECGYHITRDELALSCNCSIRTLQRDINILIGCNAPIEYDTALRTYRVTNTNWNAAIHQFDVDDYISLALARSYFASMDLPYSDRIKMAFDHILSTTESNLPEILSKASEMVSKLTKPSPKSGELHFTSPNPMETTKSLEEDNTLLRR